MYLRTSSGFSGSVLCFLLYSRIIFGFIYCSNCFTYQLIDERSKQYSSAGDDKVNQTITDLVRGPLASGIKQMLEQVKRDQKLSLTCNFI